MTIQQKDFLPLVVRQAPAHLVETHATDRRYRYTALAHAQ